MSSNERGSELRAIDLSARGTSSGGVFGSLTRQIRSGGQIFAGASAEPTIAAAAQGTSAGGGDVDSPGVTADDDGYRLNFENAEVSAVAKAILGDILKVNYVIDRRVSGQISLTSSRPVARANLVPLLESALTAVGAVLVKGADLYRIAPSAEPGGLGALDPRAATAGFGTTVISAKYVPAATLGHLLEGFGSRAGTIRVDPGTNFVIVQGTEAERRAALDAASQVDVDWLRSKSVAMLPLANSSPETIIAELNRILDTGEGGLSQNVVQFQPMSRLNAILAVSRRHDAIKLVARWVARLDRADAAPSGMNIYHLKYAQSKTAAGVLNDMFGGGNPQAGPATSDQSSLDQTGPGAQVNAPATAAVPGQAGGFQAGGFQAAALNSGAGSGAAPPGLSASVNGPRSVFGDLSSQRGPPGSAEAASGNSSRGSQAAQRIRIIPDVNTNTLFISASATDYPAVERAIRQLDSAPVQVNIEATIAEVQLKKDLQYGVQVFLQNSKGSLGLAGATGVPLSSSYPGLNLLRGALANPTVLISALQSVTDVKILSSPSLVVLDRQPAVLQVGDQVPILTRTAQSVENPAAPVVNNVDYRDTGIILNVLPRVNANGVVILDIEQQISSVNNPDSRNLTPTISQRRVRSSVAVPNGQTVLLAGLITSNQTSTRSGIPGIVQLKFINDLLASHEGTLDRTELIIFIKPQIISNAADAEQVSEEFRDRIISMRGGASASIVRKY